MSCFSVWGEGGEGFGNFPIPKAYKEGENVYHYELTWRDLPKYSHFRRPLLYAYRESLELTYMEETEKWHLANRL